MHIPTKDEIKKRLAIVEWFCGLAGLDILYDLDEKEMRLERNPEDSCKLLKRTGLINDFCGSGPDVTVERVTILDDCDYAGEHVQKERVEHLYWDDFVFHFNLSQHDAINIIAEYEHGKAIQAAFDDALESSRAQHYATHHSHTENKFLS